MFGKKKNLPKREPAEVRVSKLKPVDPADDTSQKASKPESETKKDEDKS